MGTWADGNMGGWERGRMITKMDGNAGGWERGRMGTWADGNVGGPGLFHFVPSRPYDLFSRSSNKLHLIHTIVGARWNEVE
jgi:hypothetical protein